MLGFKPPKNEFVFSGRTGNVQVDIYKDRKTLHPFGFNDFGSIFVDFISSSQNIIFEKGKRHYYDNVRVVIGMRQILADGGVVLPLYKTDDGQFLVSKEKSTKGYWAYMTKEEMDKRGLNKEEAELRVKTEAKLRSLWFNDEIYGFKIKTYNPFDETFDTDMQQDGFIGEFKYVKENMKKIIKNISNDAFEIIKYI